MSQFLKNTFAGTGTKVDLSSMGDIDTLTLGRLLKVDGVELMSFSVKETDKVLVETEATTGAEDIETATNRCFLTTGSTMTTTTLGKDGSSSEVIVDDITGKATRTTITTFVGGTKIVEQPLHAGNTGVSDDDCRDHDGKRPYCCEYKVEATGWYLLLNSSEWLLEVYSYTARHGTFR